MPIKLLCLYFAVQLLNVIRPLFQLCLSTKLEQWPYNLSVNLVFAYLNSTPNPEAFKPRDYLFVHEKGLLHVTLRATAPSSNISISHCSAPCMPLAQTRAYHTRLNCAVAEKSLSWAPFCSWVSPLRNQPLANSVSPDRERMKWVLSWLFRRV